MGTKTTKRSPTNRDSGARKKRVRALKTKIESGRYKVSNVELLKALFGAW